MSRVGMALVCPRDSVDCNQLASLTQKLYNITADVPFRVGQVAVVWFALQRPECISKSYYPDAHKVDGTPTISVNEVAKQLALRQFN